MITADKKKISNEKRLQAISNWKNRNKNVVREAGTSENVVDLTVGNNVKSKLNLFDSDGEEEKYDDCFAFRPQFAGPSGQRLLEMSSELSSRFKLDERFKDDEEPQELAEESEEKRKNLKILESVLGYQIYEKYDRSSSAKKRKLMRFDPEDENAAKYIKTGVSHEKSQKKTARGETDISSKEDIPISTERYVEVSSNLKDVLSSSSRPFSFSQKFYSDDSKLEKNNEAFDISFEDVKERNEIISSPCLGAKKDVYPKARNIYFEPKDMKKDSFFISEDDYRLKEGVAFFMRPKPLEEIREEWKKRSEEVSEIFRRKRRSSQKSCLKKGKSIQRNTYQKRMQNRKS